MTLHTSLNSTHEICNRCGGIRLGKSWATTLDRFEDGTVPNGGLTPCGDLHEFEATTGPGNRGLAAPIALTNALPASLLTRMECVEIFPIPTPWVARLWKEGWLSSAIGHEDTARVISGLLSEAEGAEVVVPCIRRSVGLDEVKAPFTSQGIGAGGGGAFIAALYEGPRLPEGSTTLPEGATLTFYVVGEVWIREGWSTAQALTTGLRKEEKYSARRGDIY